jgi:hypothetical protein
MSPIEPQLVAAQVSTVIGVHLRAAEPANKTHFNLRPTVHACSREEACANDRSGYLSSSGPTRTSRSLQTPPPAGLPPLQLGTKSIVCRERERQRL